MGYSYFARKRKLFINWRRSVQSVFIHSVESVTLEDVYEPYLMQIGFLTRTPRGRCATRLAYEHLGLKAPETGSPEDNGQQSLF